MSKTAIISLDLAAMVGSVRLQLPTNPLPRRPKEQLELSVARGLIEAAQLSIGGPFTNLRTNPHDPPDVFFEHQGVTIGMELTELLPPNRFEKDAIIQSLRREILSGLAIGPKTRNRIVHISFKDDYSEKLRPKSLVDPLVGLLNRFFDASGAGRFSLPVPPELDGTLSHITVGFEDLSCDPRISDANHPLIIFGAQHTMIVPDDDIPTMLDAALGPKLVHDLTGTTWLLLWSHHPAIASAREHILSRLGSYLSTKTIRYQRIFYLDLVQPGVLAHLPIVEERRPLSDRVGAQSK